MRRRPPSPSDPWAHILAGGCEGGMSREVAPAARSCRCRRRSGEPRATALRSRCGRAVHRFLARRPRRSTSFPGRRARQGPRSRRETRAAYLTIAEGVEGVEDVEVIEGMAVILLDDLAHLCPLLRVSTSP